MLAVACYAGDCTYSREFHWDTGVHACKPDGTFYLVARWLFYSMKVKAQVASSIESSLSGACRTGGRREDKKHARGGGRDPAVDDNPVA